MGDCSMIKLLYIGWMLSIEHSILNILGDGVWFVAISMVHALRTQMGKGGIYG